MVIKHGCFAKWMVSSRWWGIPLWIKKCTVRLAIGDIDCELKEVDLARKKI